MKRRRSEFSIYDDSDDPSYLEWLHRDLVQKLGSMIFVRLLLLPASKKRKWDDAMIREVAHGLAAEIDDAFQLRFKNLPVSYSAGPGFKGEGQ